jgi:hypothetical protein
MPRLRLQNSELPVRSCFFRQLIFAERCLSRAFKTMHIKIGIVFWCRRAPAVALASSGVFSRFVE